MATYAFLRDKIATDKYTHLSADWCEKYNILDSDVELLHDAISKDYNASVYPCVMEAVVKSSSKRAVVFDFDLLHQNPKWKINKDDLLTICQTIHNEVSKYVSDPKSWSLLVMERSKPYLKQEKKYSKGLHFQFPKLVLSESHLVSITNNLSLRLKVLFDRMAVGENVVDNVINKAWYLLGCTKKNTQPYMPSYVFTNGDLTKTKFKDITRNVIYDMSIRECIDFEDYDMCPDHSYKIIETTDDKLDRVLIEHHIRDSYRLVKTNSGFTLITTKQGLGCPIHGRVHEKANAWMCVKEDGKIIFYCHRDGTTKILGMMASTLEFETEYEAGMWLLNAYGKESIKYCEGQLYVFSNDTGMWITDKSEIRTQFLVFQETLKDWVKVKSKWDRVYEMLFSLTNDRDFLRRMSQTSLGKLLFMDGIYDFETGTFSREFTPSIFFPHRIELPFPNKNKDDMTTVNKILFENPFIDDLSKGEALKASLSRAIAGHIEDKLFFICVGSPNASKGVLTDAFLSAFANYIGIFNGGVLCYQGKNKTEDELRNKELMNVRFSRCIFSNEISMEQRLDANRIKMNSSGGDCIKARGLYSSSIDFVPHYTAFLLSNDIPQISPIDDATKERLRIFEFNQIFKIHPKEGEQQADPNIKKTLRQAWFRKALICLIIEAYKSEKIDLPECVLNNTQEWTDNSNGYEQVLPEYFEITTDEEDIVTNKTISAFIKQVLNDSVSLMKVRKTLQKMGAKDYRKKVMRGLSHIKTSFFA